MTILLLAPYWYFNQPRTPIGPQIDAIKMKLGAPERTAPERILTTEFNSPEVSSESAVVETATDEEEEENALAVYRETNLEEVEAVSLPDVEESWNTELKSMLLRVEPLEGEQIFKSWQTQQESYHAEMDALLNEKQQRKENDSMEIDQLIQQLEEKNQSKLKDILGAHYEAVLDHYDDFMEASETE